MLRTQNEAGWWGGGRGGGGVGWTSLDKATMGVMWSITGPHDDS